MRPKSRIQQETGRIPKVRLAEALESGSGTLDLGAGRDLQRDRPRRILSSRRGPVVRGWGARRPETQL